MALVKIGLTEYYDINYITTDLPALEQVLESRLEKMLQTLGEQAADSYESSFTAKKILEWSYTDELPKNIAGFDLFINPHQPVKTINGSYIIIDYCDFAAASNLVVFYNVYRDEFFSELRVKLTPRMLGLFDERDLDQLAKKMKNNLQPVLQGLRAEVGG
jgi:hypothetical protein